MNDSYVAALGSLRRICSSAGLPAERVVVGGPGMVHALGLTKCAGLVVWTDPLSFELVASVYPGASTPVAGARNLHTWIPSGELVLRTGPWNAGSEDFSGTGEAVPNRGFLHWDVDKTLRWLESVNRHSAEASKLRKWQSRTAQVVGPHGAAGYLARKRDGKEA